MDSAQNVEDTVEGAYQYATDLVNDYIDNHPTESEVITNKAQVSKDPIFDYQTYFRENLS
jgi:hypothetical protein